MSSSVTITSGQVTTNRAECDTVQHAGFFGSANSLSLLSLSLATCRQIALSCPEGLTSGKVAKHHAEGDTVQHASKCSKCPAASAYHRFFTFSGPAAHLGLQWSQLAVCSLHTSMCLDRAEALGASEQLNLAYLRLQCLKLAVCRRRL